MNLFSYTSTFLCDLVCIEVNEELTWLQLLLFLNLSQTGSQFVVRIIGLTTLKVWNIFWHFRLVFLNILLWNKKKKDILSCKWKVVETSIWELQHLLNLLTKTKGLKLNVHNNNSISAVSLKKSCCLVNAITNIRKTIWCAAHNHGGLVLYIAYLCCLAAELTKQITEWLSAPAKEIMNGYLINWLGSNTSLKHMWDKKKKENPVAHEIYWVKI